MEVDGDSEDELMLPSQNKVATETLSVEYSIEMMSLCAENFALMLKKLALRDQPETARNIAETFADVSSVPTLPSQARTAALNVLSALLSPGHGGIREVSAMVFKLLTQHTLGILPGGKIAAKDATAVRIAALNFIQNALTNIPGCEEAAAAFMRHAVLKTPEKADGRAAAVETAVTLCKALGPQYLHCFVGFIVKLSRTSKANQRFMAVELSAAFIEAFESPFNPDTAAPTHHAASPLPILPPASLIKATTTGLKADSSGYNNDQEKEEEFVVQEGGLLRRGWISNEGHALIPAPWGAVLLAVLHQRSSDKIPAVRARALHHIATLASNITRAKEAAFIVALAAAEAVDLSVAGTSGRTPGSVTTGNSKKGNETTTEGDIDGHDVNEAPGSNKDTENTPHNEGDKSDRRSNVEKEEGGRPVSEAGNASVGTAMSRESVVLFRTLAFPVPAASFFPGEEENAAATADLKPLLTMARLRCRDAKGAVRKSAVQLLQALIFIEAGRQPLAPVLEPRDVAALEAAAGDSLLTVRKAALLAAAQLAATLPWDGATAELWVSAGLPLIRDPESVIQDAVVDQVEELILARAVGAGKEKASQELLPVLAAISRGGAAGRACLARTCAQLKAKNRLQAKKVTTGLEKMLVEFQQQRRGAQEDGAEMEEEDDKGISPSEEDTISGTWILYAEIAAQAPSAPSWEFLQSQWAALTSTTTDAAQQSQHAAQLLRVIATAAAEFPPDQALALCAQLRANLETLALPPGAAAAHVAALAQLTRTAHRNVKDTTLTSMATWTASLFSLCESGLAASVEALRCCGESSIATAATALAGAPSALFITGEVALLRASTPSSRLVTLVQALTSATLAAGLSAASAIERQTPMPTPRDARSEEDEGAIVEGKIAATSAPPAASIATAASVPATVQALAWVTLGKLCLVNESLAKKCVPLFVQELGRAASPAVRNNIMVALADLVINYTALVDSHIPRLAACLRDPNELVRTQALGLLANLLQKDYVKWRGPLFLRFMLALIDESPRVAAMAEFLLSDALDSKLPNLAYNHFVEALFVLNDCQVGLAGGAAAAAAMADLPGAAAAEREAFCLKGADPIMRSKRDAIYQ
jgi:condensin-2 complex subunit D3